VYVAADWVDRLPGPSEEERELLEELDSTRETSRLSCQVSFEESLDGLEVEIAPEE
jgi:2Fe-2S ferredoxin